MYNKEQKIKFIQEYTHNLSMARLCETVFNKIEPFEQQWNADLCTKTTMELQPVVDSIVGFRARSRWSILIVLKDYVKWCIGNGIPDVCDGMLQIKTTGVESMKIQMVSMPKHLQKYLDELCDPESQKTTDNIYRCFYWLAYSGMKEEDILQVKCKDVDLENMVVHYNGEEFLIYREAIQAFKNCATLDSFVFNHPLYAADKVVIKPRAEGDTLVRGIRSVSTIKAMRMTLSRKSKECVDAGKTKLKLSYYRVWLSGLFYRMYELEKSGLPVDFTDAALRFMEGKEYKLNKGCKNTDIKKREVAKDYLEDYQRWKLAFFL